MEQILLPSKVILESSRENSNLATVVIEPCYYGYGTTLGNALRRVLLSSLPGAAVTAVKIKGAPHEFTAIPGVKEDVVEIILNLKQLRLQLHAPEARLSLHVKGEKKITAKDIEKHADVDIVNPKLHIATTTGATAELEMEIFVAQGRGYVPVEDLDRKKLELGTIAIDAVYTPIRAVGFKVEPTRVGEVTNYDKLLLSVETDGTITPQDALRAATQVLIEHFSILHQGTVGGEESAVVDEAAPSAATVAHASETGENETEEKGAKKRGRKKKA